MQEASRLADPESQQQLEVAFAYNALSIAIPEALEDYATDNRTYPTTEQGLAVLTELPDTVPTPIRPYLYPQLLTDPWNNHYQYANANGSIKLQSFGPDQVANTADDLIVEFPAKSFQDLALSDEEITQLSQTMQAAVEPQFIVDFLNIQEDGEFVLQISYSAEAPANSGGLSKTETLEALLRASTLFDEIEVLRQTEASPESGGFALTGRFVGDIDGQVTTDEFARIQRLMGSQCMQFAGFQVPTRSKCDFSPQNLVYSFNQRGTSLTVQWDCPERNGTADFYWFCCSCEDNTSHSLSVDTNEYTFPVKPNQEYAFSVGCRGESGVLQCESPLEAVRFK